MHTSPGPWRSSWSQPSMAVPSAKGSSRSSSAPWNAVAAMSHARVASWSAVGTTEAVTRHRPPGPAGTRAPAIAPPQGAAAARQHFTRLSPYGDGGVVVPAGRGGAVDGVQVPDEPGGSIGITRDRSEEHTSELQSNSFISYAVFCLKKKTNKSATLLTCAGSGPRPGHNHRVSA